MNEGEYNTGVLVMNSILSFSKAAWSLSCTLVLSLVYPLGVSECHIFALSVNGRKHYRVTNIFMAIPFILKSL